jgi:hypothetical protein
MSPTHGSFIQLHMLNDKVACCARIKIRYRSDLKGSTCDVFGWGKHSPGFFPLKNPKKPRLDVLHEVDKLIEAKVPPQRIKSILMNEGKGELIIESFQVEK